MRFQLSLAALVLALAVCATATASGGNTFTVAGTRVLVYSPAGHARGRVILMHGLSSDADAFASDPNYAPLRQKLVAAGYQVLTPDLPFHDAATAPNDRVTHLIAAMTADSSHGADYVKAWTTEFDGIAAWADRRYGRLPLIAGGISWGGFHALAAACYATHPVAGFFAMMPVVDLEALGEFQGIDTSGSSLSGCVTRLATERGYLSYGLLDKRVDWHRTSNLAASLWQGGDRHLTVNTFQLDHSTTPATIAAASRWAAVKALR